MLDSGLLSKNFIGRDGFIWWIGQVPDAKIWNGNLPTLPQNSPSDLPGFQYRVKVRILGYHTSDLTTLSDEELPWALVMLPTTAGSGSGGNTTTPRFSGGEFVFGFFLDGDNGQQPVIIGHLGNSTQTILSKSLPSLGFKPFSGYTSTGKQVPSHGQRDPAAVQRDRIQGGTNAPPIPVSSGSAAAGGGVQPSNTNYEQMPAAELKKILRTDLTPTKAEFEAAKKAREEGKAAGLSGEPLEQKVLAATARAKFGPPNATSPVTVSATTPNPAKPANPEGGNGAGDIRSKTQVNQQQDNKEYTLANACKKDKKNKSKIKSAIKNLTRAIKGMQRINDTYINPSLNEIANITAEIRKCAGIINGFIQEKLNKFRDWVINEIKKRYEKLANTLRAKDQIKVGENLQEILDIISCLFDKIMDSLFDLLVDFLSNMLDKILNAAQCIIDSMIGALLDSIIGPIEGVLNMILAPLSAFLGAASGSLDQALSFVSAIESFLSCEKEDPCPEVEIWSWLDGPKPSEDDEYSKELKNIRSSPSTSLSNFLGNPSEIPPSAGSISECLSGPGLCGPPAVQLFGGGGIGAAANAIIGSSGEILAVDILSSGINYYSNPFVYFDDPCGKGSGAKAEVIVGTSGENCGKIVGVRVVDGGTGYLKKPNGSLGSSGVTSVDVGLNANALILPSGADFVIDTSVFTFPNLGPIIESFKQKIKSGIGTDSVSSGIGTNSIAPAIETECNKKVNNYPNIPITILPGGTAGVNSGCSIILSPTLGEIKPDCKFTKSGNTYTFHQDCVVTIPPIPSKIDSDTSTSVLDTYNVVLELDDVIIKNTGINYSLDDKICITPDNGAKLEPQFDPYGRLVNVRILNRGTFVTERPSIKICNTKTGINADMFAVLKVKRTTKEEAQKLGQDKIISVIDCVGKVNG